MKASKQDIMSAAIIHLQCALEYLDEVGTLQDLFKQDYKRQVKRTIELTEQKMGDIMNAMNDEDKSLFYELFEEKSKIYNHIDKLNTYEKIAMFRNYMKINNKIEYLEPIAN